MYNSLRILSTVLAILLLSLAQSTLVAQERTYRLACIGFYNVENLFDTLDSPEGIDEYFTPQGANVWTPERYQEKLIPTGSGHFRSRFRPIGPQMDWLYWGWLK